MRDAVLALGRCAVALEQLRPDRLRAETHAVGLHDVFRAVIEGESPRALVDDDVEGRIRSRRL